jgi:DTW domain-containing protein YfiP
VETSVEFLILRHIYEAEKPSNTGRLAALALTNSKLISCGGGQRIGLACVDDDLLNAPGTWLLWPEQDRHASADIRQAIPARVVVIDATWQQARRLYSSLPALWRMPRLALEAPVAQRKRLRDQHSANYMSHPGGGGGCGSDA